MRERERINGRIAGLSEGVIFRYEDLGIANTNYQTAAKALERMVKSGEIKRATTGAFYKPKKTIFGELRPSEQELLKIYLFKSGKRVAYVTGTALYNRLGITTQVPRIIHVANRDGNIRTTIGNLKVLPAKSYVEVTDSNCQMLELLDAMKDLKKIPDLDLKNAITYFGSRISQFRRSERKELIQIALSYPPRVRALLGAMVKEGEATALKASLNPLSVFRLGISAEELPSAAKWKIT